MNWYHQALMRVRPAELAVLLKRVSRVKRLNVETDAGFQIWLDPVSHFGAEVIRTGTYEPDLLSLLQRLLRPGDNFVDIGANEGFFSLAASYAVGKGKVLSIEPQSRLIPVIERNIRLNRLTNISLVHGAVGAEQGEITLNLAPDTNTGSSSVYSGLNRWTMATEKVRAFPLDTLLAQHNIDRVRLLKIDCEGAEKPIFDGCDKLIREGRADFIAVEFHPHLTGEGVPQGIDALLRKHGYQLTEVFTQQWFYHRPELAGELMQFSPIISILPLVA